MSRKFNKCMALSVVSGILLLIGRILEIASHDCGLHCPCYMGGIYYNHDDMWYDPTIPCIKYRCRIGYFEEIERGIPFKGECYLPGDTWREGCFKYEGLSDGPLVYYRLLVGGCADDTGGCWTVGETRSWNCVVQQCRIVDGCFRIDVISAGCQTGEGCQKIDSLWHDGCEVYQCREKNGIPHTEVITDESVMDWPRGQYGLLKPKTGCPDKIHNDMWVEGSRLHYGNGSNSWSTPLDLFGEYTTSYFNHHFCIQSWREDVERHLKYQTYWEPGFYCIFKFNASCSQGFQDGFVRMQDVYAPGESNAFNGTLPDGEYDDYITTLKFCCRNDGNPHHPIILPMRQPFVLFMLQGANVCQRVRGMDSEVQYFSFDEGPADNPIRTDGKVPEVKFGNGATTFYFCHYKPMECGCTDADGDYVALWETVTDGCKTWRCVNRVNSIGKYETMLELYKGGCETLEGCKAYNEHWVEMEGETCTNYSCQAIHNGSNISFVIKEILQGCRDGYHCRPIGYAIGNGCLTMVCSQDTDYDMPYFKAAKEGCKDSDGNCHELASTLTRECTLYQCQEHRGWLSFHPIKAGCRWREQCVKYHPGQILTFKQNQVCFNYICQQSGDHYYGRMVDRDCLDSHGICIKPGDNIRSIKYQNVEYFNCTCNFNGYNISALCQSDQSNNLELILEGEEESSQPTGRKRQLAIREEKSMQSSEEQSEDKSGDKENRSGRRDASSGSGQDASDSSEEEFETHEKRASNVQSGEERNKKDRKPTYTKTKDKTSKELTNEDEEESAELQARDEVSSEENGNQSSEEQSEDKSGDKENGSGRRKTASGSGENESASSEQEPARSQEQRASNGYNRKGRNKKYRMRTKTKIKGNNKGKEMTGTNEDESTEDQTSSNQSSENKSGDNGMRSREGVKSPKVRKVKQPTVKKKKLAQRASRNN